MGELGVNLPLRFERPAPPATTALAGPAGMMVDMFSGLVEEMGVVESVRPAGPGARLALKCSLVAKDACVGDSIAVAGCCLTVVKKQKGLLSFDVGEESLLRTNLRRLKKGDRVNLERSLA